MSNSVRKLVKRVYFSSVKFHKTYELFVLRGDDFQGAGYKTDSNHLRETAMKESKEMSRGSGSVFETC